MPPEDEDDNRPYATRDELSAEPSNDMNAATHQNLYLEQFGDGSNTPIITDPKDGLPRPADDVNNPAPSLAESTCIEDKSVYVEAFKDEASDIVSALSRETEGLSSMAAQIKLARHIRDHAKDRFKDDGSNNLRETFQPDQVKMRHGVWHVGDKVVRPRRLQCIKYFSQEALATDVDGTAGPVKPRHSFCKELRSTSGAYFGLMDETIVSCEERRPIDEATVQKLRDRIRLKVIQGKNRVVETVVPEAKEIDIFEGFSESEHGLISCFDVECDQEIYPGKSTKLLFCGPGWIAQEERIFHKLIAVGTGWMPNEVTVDQVPSFFGKPGVDYHTVIVSPQDYSDQNVPASSKTEFLGAWPRHATYGYLENSLQMLPPTIVSALCRGENVAVVAADPSEAKFMACLVARALTTSRSKTRIDIYSDEESPELKHEHIAYLKRTRLGEPMPKPQGNPPAPVAAPSDGGFDFSALNQVPTLQEGGPAVVQAPPAAPANNIDSANYIEVAKFSLAQHGDLAEVSARFSSLLADIQNDKVDTKTALIAVAALAQTLGAVVAVKTEGLLSEIEDAGGIDEEDADDIGDFLEEVRNLAENKKIIFLGAKEKDAFMAKLEKAEDALDNYLEDEDEPS